MTQGGSFLISTYISLQLSAHCIFPSSFFLFIHNCLLLSFLAKLGSLFKIIPTPLHLQFCSLNLSQRDKK